MYNTDCHKHMRANSCTGIDKLAICGLARKSYVKALSPGNLKSSFRKAGIYPFDAKVNDRSVFIPAKIICPPASKPHEIAEEPVGNHNENPPNPNSQQAQPEEERQPDGTKNAAEKLVDHQMPDPSIKKAQLDGVFLKRRSS